ncbi:hypothetical protein AKO1_006579 [Acrasis kona]|uniref:Uncharacterized protein n=1 Tax=Acrasis kona TaxID=1008807 RepID=A0AAW2ZL66_9EUKA
MGRDCFQVYCSVTEEKLERWIETEQGTDLPSFYQQFHVCKCHHKLCTAKCTCGVMVEYALVSKHVRQEGHAVYMESGATSDMLKKKSQNSVVDTSRAKKDIGTSRSKTRLGTKVRDSSKSPESLPSNHVEPSHELPSNAKPAETMYTADFQGCYKMCDDALNNEWICIEEHKILTSFLCSPNLKIREMAVGEIMGILKYCSTTNDYEAWSDVGRQKLHNVTSFYYKNTFAVINF